MSGYSEQPRNPVERIADAGLEALKSQCLVEGLELKRSFVLVQIEGTEPDAVTAGNGIEDGRDLLAFVLSSLISAAKELGLTIKVVPMEKMGRG